MFSCKNQGSSLPFTELPRIDVIYCAVFYATGHEGSLFPWLCAAPFRKGRERAIEGSIFVAQSSTVPRCSPQSMPSSPPPRPCHVVVEPGPHCASRLPLSRGRAAAQAQSSAQSPRRQGANHHTTFHEVEGFRLIDAHKKGGVCVLHGVCERQGFQTGEHWTKMKEGRKKTWASGPGLGYRLRRGRTLGRFLRPKKTCVLMYRHGAAKLSTAAGGRGPATRRTPPHALACLHLLLICNRRVEAKAENCHPPAQVSSWVWLGLEVVGQARTAPSRPVISCFCPALPCLTLGRTPSPVSCLAKAPVGQRSRSRSIGGECFAFVNLDEGIPLLVKLRCSQRQPCADQASLLTAGGRSGVERRPTRRARPISHHATCTRIHRHGIHVIAARLEAGPH